MKRWGKVIAAIIIGGILLYGIYLVATTGENILSSLRILMPMLCSGFLLLSNVFSKRKQQPWKSALVEDKEFCEARERLNHAGKIVIVGIIMVILPIVLLFIFNELKGFFATLALYSVGIGILAFVVGLIVSLIAIKDLSKFNVESVKEAQLDNPISKCFEVLGWLALLGWVVLMILDAMNVI